MLSAVLPAIVQALQWTSRCCRRLRWCRRARMPLRAQRPCLSPPPQRASRPHRRPRLTCGPSLRRCRSRSATATSSRRWDSNCQTARGVSTRVTTPIARCFPSSGTCSKPDRRRPQFSMCMRLAIAIRLGFMQELRTVCSKLGCGLCQGHVVPCDPRRLLSIAGEDAPQACALGPVATRQHPRR